MSSVFVGRYGSVRFQRDFPAPRILPTAALSGNTVLVNADSWLPTDNVVFVYKDGGSYTSLSGYLHRSELDRVTFHTTPEGALNNDPATVISLSAVDPGPMAIASAGTSGQTTTLTSYLNTLTPAPTAETSLQAAPSTYNTYKAAGGSVTPWLLQGMLKSYRLNTSGNAVDTTGLGDYFSESVKTLVSGDGTLDFVINLFEQADLADSDPLLRAALLLGAGSEARGRFYLREPRPDLVDYGGRVPFRGALFYEAKLIVTDCVVDCAADDIITGSADFVTTGPISLLSSTS